MLQAADKLTNSADSLANVAVSIGYESESTFSIAFKRAMGCSPRQYSRSRNSVCSDLTDEASQADQRETVAAV
jgi:AraC-like DNA-binding protein